MQNPSFKRQTGTERIKVTPEMVEAGVWILIEGRDGGDFELVEAIYREMVSVSEDA